MRGNAHPKSSLPCNVDQAELSRLLSSHLAEHQEVRSVKVVRDSKGGICAFIQCEVGPLREIVVIPSVTECATVGCIVGLFVDSYAPF